MLALNQWTTRKCAEYCAKIARRNKMLTFHHKEPMGVSDSESSTQGVYYCQGTCISSDDKPTEGIFNGSELKEMDTGKTFLFDASNGDWLEQT